MNPIVWKPNNKKMTLMWQFKTHIEQLYQCSLPDYEALHAWSINKPAFFWKEVADFFKVPFNTMADDILTPKPHMKDTLWFTGAQLNYAQALLQRADDHPAIISLSEQGQKRTITYLQLKEKVAAVAAGLKEMGVKQGDRVAAVLPNVDYTVIAFLACASIGAIWSSCSPDFGSQAIVDRIGQIEPKVLFIGNGHYYQGKQYDGFDKLEQLQKEIQSLEHIILCPTIESSDKTASLSKLIKWADVLKLDEPLEFTPLSFNHPLYILFSSGTTGKPKCIVHRTGGVLLQHLKELGLHTDIKPSDNLLFYTTCGWMMWNWMVSVLALGATLTLYEGAPTYPHALNLLSVVDSENVSVFGTSAKYLSSLAKEGLSPKKHYAFNALNTILATGSPLLPPHYDFVYQHIKDNVQLSSISGGTDIVSCFALGNPIKPVYRGEIQSLGLGMSVEVFNEQGQSLNGMRGELVCTKPFPSMPLGFWQDKEDEKYLNAYFTRFPGVWAHGDFAEITEHHGLIIYGRSDTVLNPGGVRIGTAEIYRQVEKIPEVSDSVVIGQTWHDDIRIILFVKLAAGIHLDEALKNRIKQCIRTHASPRHVPSKIIQVPDIPRTINNKVVETAVKKMVHGEAVENEQSLANPQSLAYFKDIKELQLE